MTLKNVKVFDVLNPLTIPDNIIDVIDTLTVAVRDFLMLALDTKYRSAFLIREYPELTKTMSKRKTMEIMEALKEKEDLE